MIVRVVSTDRDRLIEFDDGHTELWHDGVLTFSFGSFQDAVAFVLERWDFSLAYII